MKKKVLSLFSIISLVIASLFVIYAVGNVYAYEPDELVDSNWLVNEGVPYQSDLTAGQTSGYGKFVLGEENITLTTNANEGFHLEGWQIVYTDEPTNITYVDSSDLTVDGSGVGSKTIQFGESGNQVDITLRYIDTNDDGYYDQGTFNISKVADNLQVVSVFDFIYYNVDISSLFDITTINSYSSEQITDSTNTIYFTDKVVGDSYTTYTDAIISINASGNSKLYYFGDLYYSENSYYTLHPVLTDENLEQKVDYTLGAFRLNDSVEASFDIDIDTQIESSVNIDVRAMSVSADGNIVDLVQDAESNSFVIQQDEYLRTSSISFNYTILNSSNQESVVNVNYHNLYTANIAAYLDDEAAEGEDINSVLNVTTVTFYYSQISDGVYFIKKASDNNNNAFRVVCAPMISRVIDARTYNYYQFESIDELEVMSMQYPDVDENITIRINYNSINYSVNFEFRLYDSATGTISQPNGNFNLEPVVSLVRGDSITINKTNASNNVGYEFYGFAFSEFQISQNTSIDVQISVDKPEEYTILMLFEYIDYSIKFVNFDQITLNDGETDYYPISRTTLSIAKGNSINTDTFYADDLRANVEKNITFDISANIGDDINLYSDIVNGFYLFGYKIGGVGDYVNVSNGINFELTSDIISQFANGENEIEIYVYENYTTYTLTYYIEATKDTYSELDTIMADLTYDTDSQSVVVNDNEDKYEIIISGLKLYDKVTLNSKGKTVNNEEIQQEYTYMFVRFTENDKTNLSYTYASGTDTYTHVETILRDISIKVVYTMPSARLQISTDRLDAYDLDNVVIYQNGLELEKTDDSVIVEAGQEIQVVLNPNGEEASSIIAFGYNLVGYTFISEGKETSTVTDELSYTYTVTSSNIQYLVINFEEIEYHLSIMQTGGGAGYDGEYVMFDEENYKVITVEDRSVSFNMPTGYFASNVYFINNGQHEYADMNQTNSYDSNLFSYEFSLQELIDLVSTYGISSSDYVDLNMSIVYQIHTYSITINFELTNPKNNDYDLMVQFPSMTIQYMYENLPQIITGNVVNNQILFDAIPYNSNVQISVTGNIPNGLSAFGWTTMLDEAPSYTHSSMSLNIPSMRQNEEFKYKLSYDSYTVNIVIDNANRGNPTVLVNNIVSDQITMYDNLKIQMNANKNNGFRFDNLYYNTYTYQEYHYSEDSWALNYLKLYTYSPVYGYVLNTSSEYNPNTTYYSYDLTQIYYNESTTYEDTLFDISNYYLEGGVITFYIQYAYLEISLVNNSSNYSDVTLIRGDISIDPSEYSTYEIIVTTNGEEHVLQEGETVNYLDSIDIYITLNTISINANESYDLSKGVYLAEIYMLAQNYTFESLQTAGQYKFSFNISDIIANVPDDGELPIYYRYLVGEKQITLTTNIDDESFYKVNDSTRFEMSYDNNMFGFDAQIYSSGGQSYLINNLQFMGKTRINYNFHTIDNVNYRDFFYINDFKIYNEAGELLIDSQTATRTDLNTYGISIIRDSDGHIQSIDIRFIENLVVKLQVQPQIIYNGAEFIDGVYIFTSTFICDNRGNGVAQKLSVGATSNNDIQSSEFILNFMMNENNEYNITYYDRNGAVVNPTNVGEYDVSIQFNDTGEYSWLSSIELDYQVRLVIVPRAITASYNMTDTFTKTYDGSSSYDATRLLQYLVFTDGAMTIAYEGSQFILTQNYSANITYTINGIETPINIANESIFYNITLSGINLAYGTYNNNFTLNNDTVTFLNSIRIMKRELNILGIQVNDKVYDGTTDVTIRQDANISLQGVLSNDDVSLIVDNLDIKFVDSTIGLQKQVNINSESALIGADAQNYKLNNTSIIASIYPYSVSTHIEGVGDVTITNRRGLTDPSLASLIPINASLKVDIINADTNEYVNIYDSIVRYLSNSNIFSIGYVLRFEVNGISRNISNSLYLTIPNEERLTGAIWLTGEQSGELDYEVQGDNITIDLNQMSANVNTIIITEQRVLLELWQIILIVIGAILLIAIIIIIFIIIRKKKKEEYSVNDKI